jgi:hypothetical protein
MQAGKENNGIAFGRLIHNGLQIFGAWLDGPDLSMSRPDAADRAEERSHSPCRACLAWRHAI